MDNINFVAGALRSGTTLLRLMLDHHPQLKNKGEFDFLFDFDQDSNAFPEGEDYRHWLETDRIFLSQDYLRLDPVLDYRSQVRDLVRQAGEPERTISFNIHRNFDRVLRVFPEARFIHLLRDPRDVARSSIGMGWAGHVYFGIHHWIETEKSWERLKPQLKAEQYIEISYEQLVRDTENTLRQVCQFLGVEYDPVLMTYSENSTYAPPDESLIEQWKRKLPKRDVQLAEYQAGELLQKRGYQPSGYEAVRPSCMEAGLLRLKNKFYVWKLWAKRYGLCLFLSEKLARRLGLSDWHRSLRVKMNRIELKYLK